MNNNKEHPIKTVMKLVPGTGLLMQTEGTDSVLLIVHDHDLFYLFLFQPDNEIYQLLDIYFADQMLSSLIRWEILSFP